VPIRRRITSCLLLVKVAGYFLRLLFSPTEEDWDANTTESSSFLDVLKRPFRLAKKHGKSDKG